MHTRLGWLLFAGLLIGTPALAGDPDAPAVEGGPDPDALALDTGSEATDAPEDGVWSWVARMEGEIPDEKTVEAAEERFEEQLAERALVEDLAVGEVPLGFYRDPGKELTVDPLFLDLVDPADFDIPIEINDDVARWVRFFTDPGRRYYTRWLQRSSTYRPLMYAHLEEAGLPADLVYLSMIESGYNTHAYSHAHASGLWQFIPSTGRIYDLRVDWWVDERRDPELSTQAAVAFLGELYRMFGNWELAWAAYNCGPGRVRRGMRRTGAEDFWTLATAAPLPRETRNYVPKIMAAAIVGKYPERYGFTDIAFQPELVYDTAVVEGSVELGVLARSAGIDEGTFRRLNPALRRWATPTGTTEVRVPQGTAAAFTAALADVPARERVAMVRHQVQRGDTLSGIAARYGVGVSELVRVNQIRRADQIFVGMNLIIPGAAEQVADVASVRATDASPAASSSSSASRPQAHTVRRGDTLSRIAARHGVSVSDLQQWNELNGTTIHVGQELTLGEAPISRTEHYTIRQGDTLSGIAARYGVSSGDVQRWNGISNPSRIQVGQTLTLHIGDAGWATYTVRAGDSLGAIARRHGCSVSDLMAWNDLRGAVIHPGQELQIRQ